MKKINIALPVFLLLASYLFAQPDTNSKLGEELGYGVFKFNMSMDDLGKYMTEDVEDSEDPFMGPVKIGHASAKIIQDGFCGLTIEDIELHFLARPGSDKTRLYLIRITVPMDADFEKLVSAVTQAYGEPMPQDDLFWDGSRDYQWWGEGNHNLSVANYRQNGEGDLDESTKGKIWIVFENQM